MAFINHRDKNHEKCQCKNYILTTPKGYNEQKNKLIIAASTIYLCCFGALTLEDPKP
jgi:hypothetical protein